jgi:HTH-type transcriptional regulator / antitoxin HigA
MMALMLRQFEVRKMELRPIRTKRDHVGALKEAEALWDAPVATPMADRLAVLVILIENYEREHFPIADPEPIEFLEHVMEARGLTRKDLEPYIGSRARVAEVLNRVRPLTLEMIRRLAAGLGIPADILIRDYKCRQAA